MSAMAPERGEKGPVVAEEKRASLFAELRQRIKPRNQFPSHIRRCFMTGKQCTENPTGRFCGRSTTETDSNEFSVFVAMPFRANLKTFYDWSLKPFLCDSFGIAEDNIRRADEFRNVGYVTCEKICRRIQESSLVVVDISVPNANVFYELGLAVGLNKYLLVFCEENSPHCVADGKENRAIAEALGLDRSKIITYPSLGVLKRNDPMAAIQTVHLEPRQVLKPPGASSEGTVPLIRPVLASGASAFNGPQAAGNGYQQDIPVPFGTAITAATGVAIQRAAQPEDKGPESEARKAKGEVKRVLEAIGCPDTSKIAAAAQSLNLVGEGEGKRLPQTYAKIAPEVNQAFALVIDLGCEDPLAYFWLGYCHARGINAIPVHRPGPSASHSKDPDPDASERVLAFDIRALWYVPFHEDDEPTVLARSLEAALVELLPRDLANLQRNLFWERLTSRRAVSIFTGAVHHPDLNREMVGDWDQRTVSELVRYLSQAGETVVTVLEKPVYAPESVLEKLRRRKGAHQPDDPTVRSAYLELVKEELRNHPDCIIVASADVNPLTEVVLAEAYKLTPRDGDCFPLHGQDPKLPNRAVIALKAKAGNADASAPTDHPSLPKDPSRLFARPGDLESGSRGFKWGDESYGTRYMSQDEASDHAAANKDSNSSLLGHIAVLPNTFAGKGTIVVLNGVSGPATFGLAEMLTGGAERAKAIAAEEMLKAINTKWDELKGAAGVEGLIEITMKSTATVEKDANVEKDQKKEREQQEQLLIRAMFYDQRDVSGWSWYTPSPEKDALAGGNPRAIQRR